MIKLNKEELEVIYTSLHELPWPSNDTYLLADKIKQEIDLLEKEGKDEAIINTDSVSDTGSIMSKA